MTLPTANVFRRYGAAAIALTAFKAKFAIHTAADHVTSDHTHWALLKNTPRQDAAL
jgi:hypothetical protein